METKIKKTSSEKYDEGVGRRKTSIARVRIFVSKKSSSKEGSPAQEIEVNGKDFKKYFPIANHQRIVISPFEKADLFGHFSVSVKVNGGGVSSQAQAVRHGIARALIIFNPELRKKLKPFGYLKRDPRMVERKKYGLKKARKAPQWSKR